MEGEAGNHDCEVSMGETPIPSQPGVYAKILSQGKKKKIKEVVHGQALETRQKVNQ